MKKTALSGATKLFGALVGTAALALSLAACAPSADEPASPTIEVGEGVIVLDVRTPEEYGAGYLEGAKLLDFNGGQFAAELSTLDPDAEYLVYCRSGNRSAQAISLMQAEGFEKVTNLGSLEQASSATGLPILGR